MQKNLTKQEQTGRSMVEMLGVLAVTGVLSIGGISGYTVAMNKHRANDILNEASKRAVAVSTQLQRGNTNPTLAEFDDYKVGGAKFDTEIGTQGTDKFVIKFSEAPSDEVWSQIQSIAGTSGVVRGYTTDTLGLVYNNDLTTDPKASDNNGKGAETCGSGNTYCSGSGLCLEGTNQTCTCSGTRPACKKCDTTTGSYDLADTSLNTKQDSCTAGKVCNNGECKSAGPVFKIIVSDDGYDHSAAQNACNGEYHLAEKSELYSAITAIGGECIYNSSYEMDLCTNTNNLTYATESIKISEIPQACWLNTMYEDETDRAWYVYKDSTVYRDDTSLGGQNDSFNNFCALCVK